MNHPSEWARFFDVNTGSYRYKHKGSGVICDTFMTIVKVFKNNVKNVARKLLTKPQKQSLKKRVRELVNLLLKKVRNKYEKYCKSEKKKTIVSECKKETCKYFAKSNAKKIRRPCEIKSNFGKRNLIKENFFSLYKLSLTCSESKSTIPREY